MKFLALALGPVIGERVRRQWAASVAQLPAWGGISVVAMATGMSRSTIQVGIKELKEREQTGIAPARILIGQRRVVRLTRSRKVVDKVRPPVS